MRILFIGPPGAGKGTQAKRLVDRLKVPHLSSGEMLRAARQTQSEVGEAAAAYMDAGRLVPDPLITRMVADRLDQADCAPGCLLDGFPRTVTQAESLDRLLHSRSSPIDVVIELRVPEDELKRRLAARMRTDDKAEVIQERVQVYRSQTQPLLDYYSQKGLLEVVEGVGAEEDVFRRIWAAVERRRTP